MTDTIIATAPNEQDAHWLAFSKAFTKMEGFEPHPRDSRANELFSWYLLGVHNQASCHHLTIETMHRLAHALGLRLELRVFKP